MENVPHKIIVHHTADTDARDQLAKVNSDHKIRGYTLSRLGYYVGYHFLINRAGNITRTREDDEEGCHTIGQNTSSLAIALEGNFDSEYPTNEQCAALQGLLGSLCEKYALGGANIFPHRAFSNKSCYGAKLSDDWARILYVEAFALRLKDKLLQVCKENGLKSF